MYKSKSFISVFDKIAKPYVDYFGEDWEFINEINDYISLLKSNSIVLDLGCGSGYITNYLTKEKLNSIGIDFSKEMINIANNKYPNNEFICDNILNIKNHFKENSIDGAISIYSLYFIPKEELDSFFKSLSFIMKPNAKMLIITIVGNGEEYINTPLMKDNGVEENLYVNYYMQDDLKKIINNNGFTIDYFKKKEMLDEKDISDKGRYIILISNNK